MPPGPHVVWKSLSLHTGVGVPPSTGVPPSVVGTQSAGMVVLPMQISQRSHGFEHWVTWVQRGHFTGSLKSAAVQVVASRMVGPPGMAQQPKQSQPLGTNLRQLSMHAFDCDAVVEHSIVCCVA